MTPSPGPSSTNWAAEERDYADCGHGGNSREGHVYLNLVLLSRWLGSRVGQETETSLDVLKAAAIQLHVEIDGLIDAWDAADEVDTNLGVDVEEAGRHLESLSGKLAATAGQADPQAARQLRQFAAHLGGTVDYFAGFDEHDTATALSLSPPPLQVNEPLTETIRAGR